MRFVPTKLEGAFVIEAEPAEDSRGLFARTFCAREFAKHGLATAFVQCSTSFSVRRGTLRGRHYQLPPACEAKMVRCLAGALHDVIFDLRPASRTQFHPLRLPLTPPNRQSSY